MDATGNGGAAGNPYSQVKELDSYLCEGFGSGKAAGQGMGAGRRSRRNSRDRNGDAKRCNVTVAVRVRPLSSRDMQAGGRNVIVSMQGNSTVIVDPTAFMAASQLESKGLEPEHINLAVWARRFEYDHCYWSCSKDGHYADQSTVFSDLGLSMLEWAWQGFNCSLFAYGQTGSGKSYSMMGTGAVLDRRVPVEQHGLIPRICNELFAQIARAAAEAGQGEGEGEGAEFAVEISYMEIYNEAAYDLLGERSRLRRPLRVREHPRTGVYVDGLSVLRVESYDDIERLLEYGGKSRTIAATSMNSQSSRSHSVFTLNFTQRSLDPTRQSVVEKLSRMHLVDLAGSERVYNTGASGLRLREANAINKSLAALADVINGLSSEHGHAGRGPSSTSTSSSGPASYVPYRNSTLTWLLKESLGGNAKTTMLATISPADAHYDETVSTLKYAERVRRVSNLVTVNESCSELRPPGSGQLEAEVLRLRRQLERLEASRDGGSAEWPASADGMCSPISSLNSAMSSFRPSTFSPSKIALVGDEIDTSSPRLVNLNQDPLFSETVTYYIQEGVTMLGSDPQACDIHLSGVDIRPHHCCITNSGGHVTIYPFSDDCETYVNGHLISTPERALAKRPGLESSIQPTPLSHKVRLILGRHHFFRFEQGTRRRHGEEEGEEDEVPRELPARLMRGEGEGETEEGVQGEEEVVVVDWDFAHRELLEVRGVVEGRGGTTPLCVTPLRGRRLSDADGRRSVESTSSETAAMRRPPLPPSPHAWESVDQQSPPPPSPSSLPPPPPPVARRPSPAFSDRSWRSEHRAARMKLRAKLAECPVSLRDDAASECGSVTSEYSRVTCENGVGSDNGRGEPPRPRSALDRPLRLQPSCVRGDHFVFERARQRGVEREGEGRDTAGGGESSPQRRAACEDGAHWCRHGEERAEEGQGSRAGRGKASPREREKGQSDAGAVDRPPDVAEAPQDGFASSPSRRPVPRPLAGPEGREEGEGEEENVSSSSGPPERNDDAPAAYLEDELYSALKRAERAETERAEISRLLVARERDIQELKKRLETRKSSFLHTQQRGGAGR